MTHDRAVKTSSLASALFFLFGVAMVMCLAFGDRVLLPGFVDLTYLPFDGAQTLQDDSARVLGAISGGLLAGLGAMMWMVTREVYAKDPNIGQHILLTGIISWFIIDSAGSLSVGAWFNVVMNLAYLAIVLVPLIAASTASTEQAQTTV